MTEGGSVVRCENCTFVYATKVLNEFGLKEFWKKYESQIHTADEEKADKRKKMYESDYEFIHPFLSVGDRILDVGCGNGDFLDWFAKDGYICEGIEYGEEAWKMTSKKYECFLGEICDFNPEEGFDLVVFRGAIQYLLNPKKDLEKAVSLLNKNGYLYITASPNSDSLCFDLYREKFSVPVTAHDYYMFNEAVLTEYLEAIGMKLLTRGNLYLNTPYENYEEDIMRIADAIKKKHEGKNINGDCPAFWDNMLTLIYRKTL